MTGLTLKPRQRAARDAVFEKLAQGVARQLVALPTGTGKTVLACDIAREFDETRWPAIWAALATLAERSPDRAAELGARIDAAFCERQQARKGAH